MSRGVPRSAWATGARLPRIRIRARGRLAVAPVVASPVALPVAPQVAPASRPGGAIAAAVGDRGSPGMPTSLCELEIGT